MPFVERNSDGDIVAVSQVQSGGCVEAVDADSIELSEFFSTVRGESAGLTATDPGFVRVVEDVIELLIDKQIILFTELPQAAQKKMLMRKNLRNVLSPGVGDILGSDDDF